MAYQDAGNARLLGIQFRDASLDDAVSMIGKWAQVGAPEGRSVHFANAYNLAIADKDSDYRAVLASGDVVFSDGRPLGLLMKLRGKPLRQVRGPSFMAAFLRRDVPGTRHYFLGASEQVLNEVTRRAEECCTESMVVGSHSPPYRDLSAPEWNAIESDIMRAKANIVWVGLGTPKQDYIVSRLAKDLGVVSVAIGAAFDFYAEHKREAPKILRFLALEWLFRFVAEPRRLWRRYLYGNVQFLRIVWRDK